MNEPAPGQPLQSQRLISLDALRGFTIAFMIIVNNPGSWEHVYAPLEHATWNGLTPTDLVFPFFLFIVGVSIAFAYSRRLQSGVSKKDIYKKIITRSVKIYLVGLFLTLFFMLIGYNYSSFTLQGFVSGIRWTGVLQRISVVFLVCSFLFVSTNWKTQVWTGVVILVAYWIIMAYVPVPGIGRPDLTVMDKNWSYYIDQLFLPGRMWKTTWDPESILSTFPAIVTGITGMLVGKILLTVQDQNKKLIWLFFIGFCSFIVASGWDWFFPINKNIWTSSYVLYTSGLAAMGLAASILVVDVLGYKGWTRLGRVYGANAIAIYVLADFLTIIFYGPIFGGHALSSEFVGGLSGIGLSAELASFLYAILYMLICYIPAYYLYKKKIFIKL